MAAVAPTAVAQVAPLPAGRRCRLCRVILDGESQTPAAAALGTCDHCASRPEARQAPARAPVVGVFDGGSAAFTVAEKSLIKRVHGFMPAQTLLDLLNERRRADLPKARPYTMAQLHEEMRAYATPEPAGDWGGLRKLLAQARRAGTLAQVTTAVVDDFAVVFSLTPGQVMRLKDIVVGAADEARGEGA